MVKYLMAAAMLTAACVACSDTKPTTQNVANDTPAPQGVYTVVGDSLLIPPFEIELTLSEKATKKLSSGKETIIVDASFNSQHVDTLLYQGEPFMVAESTKELDAATKSVRFEAVKFHKRLLDSIVDKDVELLINVYSGRKSSQDNLLDCGFVSDKASVFKDKKYKINCKLIYGE